MLSLDKCAKKKKKKGKMERISLIYGLEWIVTLQSIFIWCNAIKTVKTANQNLRETLITLPEKKKALQVITWVNRTVPNVSTMHSQWYWELCIYYQHYNDLNECLNTLCYMFIWEYVLTIVWSTALISRSICNNRHFSIKWGLKWSKRTATYSYIRKELKLVWEKWQTAAAAKVDH